MSTKEQIEKQEPSEDASLEDWQQWAYQMKGWVDSKRLQRTKLQRKISQLKQSITAKEKVIKFYKYRISELEESEKSSNPSFTNINIGMSLLSRIKLLLSKYLTHKSK